MPATSHPEETLCEEIFAEARRESSEIICRAQERARTLLEDAAAAAEKARRTRVGLAQTEAVRRRELILATVPIETGRLRAEQIEKSLSNIYQAARQRLVARVGFDYRNALIALIEQAIGRMTGDEFVIRVSSSDHTAIGPGITEQVVLHTDRPSLRLIILDDPAITEGGFIIQDPEGRRIWDDRLPIRLERLWPELRRQVALQTGLLSRADPAGAPV